MRVVVIDYNAGNIHSVVLALERLGLKAVLSANAEEIGAADRVIFPGVGEASSAMAFLRQRGLDRVITGLRQPVLAICLGLQLLCRHSEENDTECLGIFPQLVKRFRLAKKIPHMGWNTLHLQASEYWQHLPPNPDVYFVHSYYAETGNDTLATAHHGETFSAALARDNFFATQFHPEKSGAPGQQILKNFLRS